MWKITFPTHVLCAQVSRASSSPVIAIQLHWYLATEFEDPLFGVRAAAVHAAFKAATTVRKRFTMNVVFVRVRVCVQTMGVAWSAVGYS